MKRITVEELKEAYATTGIKPVDGMYAKTSMKCACGVSVMLAHKLGYSLDELQASAHDGSIEMLAERELGLDDLYIEAFIRGFDGMSANMYHVDDEKYTTGYTDGWNARKVLIYGVREGHRQEDEHE